MMSKLSNQFFLFHLFTFGQWNVLIVVLLYLIILHNILPFLDWVFLVLLLLLSLALAFFLFAFPSCQSINIVVGVDGGPIVLLICF
jgi:hypothetical protein